MARSQPLADRLPLSAAPRVVADAAQASARAMALDQPILFATVMQDWIRDTGQATGGAGSRHGAGLSGELDAAEEAQQARNTLARKRRPGSMSGVDRAAILLLSLGEEVAGSVLARLAPVEINLLGAAMLRHPVVAREHLSRIVASLHADSNRLTVLATEPEAFLRGALAVAVGPQRARQFEATIGARRATSVADVLHWLPDQAIAEFLQREPPQIGAVLLAQLSASRAAVICKLADAELVHRLLSRLAHSQVVAPSALQDLAKALKAMLEGDEGLAMKPSVGHDAAEAIAKELHLLGLPLDWLGPGQP